MGSKSLRHRRVLPQQHSEEMKEDKLMVEVSLSGIGCW